MKNEGWANTKAILTLQCGLSPEQLSKVGLFSSAKKLWEQLIELYEGTRDSRITKGDLLASQV